MYMWDAINKTILFTHIACPPQMVTLCMLTRMLNQHLNTHAQQGEHTRTQTTICGQIVKSLYVTFHCLSLVMSIFFFAWHQPSKSAVKYLKIRNVLFNTYLIFVLFIFWFNTWSLEATATNPLAFEYSQEHCYKWHTNYVQAFVVHRAMSEKTYNTQCEDM